MTTVIWHRETLMRVRRISAARELRAGGDLAFSTTLLPGEKVRLFTQDRRTRSTFDTARKVSYRHE